MFIVKSKSSTAYNGMRDYLNLPSESTLYDYSHVTSHVIDLQPSVVESFRKNCVNYNCGDRSPDVNKYVGHLMK